jgi:hypothetical protein
MAEAAAKQALQAQQAPQAQQAQQVQQALRVQQALQAQQALRVQQALQAQRAAPLVAPEVRVQRTLARRLTCRGPVAPAMSCQPADVRQDRCATPIASP